MLKVVERIEPYQSLVRGIIEPQEKITTRVSLSALLKASPDELATDDDNRGQQEFRGPAVTGSVASIGIAAGLHAASQISESKPVINCFSCRANGYGHSKRWQMRR
jgi:hypothetical protein